MDQEQLLVRIDLIQSELSKIVPDFKLMDQEVPLVDSSYKYFSVIFRDIKENMIREINKAIEPLQNEIKRVNDQLEQHKGLYKFKSKEIENTVETLKARADNISIDTTANMNSIHTINDTLENLKEDIIFKATQAELNALSNVVETKASHVDLEETKSDLKTDLFNCVKLSQFDALQETVEKLKKQAKKLATIDSMINTTSLLREWAQEELKKHVLLEDFGYYKDDIKMAHRDIYQKIERTESVQGFTNDAFRKEFAHLDKEVKRRPWRKDIEIFRMNLQEAAKIIELQKHKETIVENIIDFNRVIDSFGKRCDKFENILARFDEILLDKASKDDIHKIHNHLPLLAKNDKVDEFKKNILESFAGTDMKLEKTIEEFQKFESLVTQVNSAFRNFKNDNKDTIQMKNTINELQTIILAKAEKVDVMAMSDGTVKKDEFLVFRNTLDMVKRQLEMQVAIGHAVLRTMVKSNDSAMTKNKQRLELLRNMNNLMNWVGIGQSDNFMSQPVLQLNKSFQEIEPSLTLPSIKHQRKYSMEASYHNTSIDVPKLRGRYDL